MGEQYDRFRSFAERYVIERAPSFTKGSERQDAWDTILDAKSIYRAIGMVSRDAEPNLAELANTAASQAGVKAASPARGATGATGATGTVHRPVPPRHAMTIPTSDTQQTGQFIRWLRKNFPNGSPFAKGGMVKGK